jgi:hypothetical protein
VRVGPLAKSLKPIVIGHPSLHQPAQDPLCLGQGRFPNIAHADGKAVSPQVAGAQLVAVTGDPQDLQARDEKLLHLLRLYVHE